MGTLCLFGNPENVHLLRSMFNRNKDLTNEIKHWDSATDETQKANGIKKPAWQQVAESFGAEGVLPNNEQSEAVSEAEIASIVTYAEEQPMVPSPPKDEQVAEIDEPEQEINNLKEAGITDDASDDGEDSNFDLDSVKIESIAQTELDNPIQEAHQNQNQKQEQQTQDQSSKSDDPSAQSHQTQDLAQNGVQDTAKVTKRPYTVSNTKTKSANKNQDSPTTSEYAHIEELISYDPVQNNLFEGIEIDENPEEINKENNNGDL